MEVVDDSNPGPRSRPSPALCSSPAAGIALVIARPAAASLVEVTNFGTNPGGMRMHVYVPDARPANPAIVVAMHGCGGSGPGFYSGSEFASLADRYGFIVIYPTATQQAGFGNCFDTWSDGGQTARRRQRPGVDRVDGDLRRSSSTAATRTGCTPPAARPAA